MSQRLVLDSMWQEIAEYQQPGKAFITRHQEDTPDVDNEALLYDTTGQQALITAADGMLAYQTPMTSSWFVLEPPPWLEDSDAAVNWYGECGEKMSQQLGNTNFHNEIHELYLDRTSFATALFYVEPHFENVWRFKCVDIGSYSIAENSNGEVDTVCIDFELTARQAVQEYGLESLPEEIQKSYLEGGGRAERKYEFFKMVYPREDYNVDAPRMFPWQMPVASVHVYRPKKIVVRESGYEEMPYLATRFFKWGRLPYGRGPGWTALPECRQLNWLQRNMDALAEKLAFPPILAPEYLAGPNQIDLRAAGVTYFQENSPQLPQEWGNLGNINDGLKRVEYRSNVVRQIFFNDLFQLFANLDQKQMTAREVAERAGEKVMGFEANHTRFNTEVLNPLLSVKFRIAMRRSVPNWMNGQDGFLPLPPPEVVRMDAGGANIDEPRPVYTSRVALAIKQAQNIGLARTTELLGPLVQAEPAMLDNYDLDQIARDSARNEGMPIGWLRQEADRDQVRQARIQREMKMIQQQQAMELTK